jgi:hypothetical protein
LLAPTDVWVLWALVLRRGVRVIDAGGGGRRGAVSEREKEMGTTVRSRSARVCAEGVIHGFGGRARGGLLCGCGGGERVRTSPSSRDSSSLAEVLEVVVESKDSRARRVSRVEAAMGREVRREESVVGGGGVEVVERVCVCVGLGLVTMGRGGSRVTVVGGDGASALGGLDGGGKNVS